MKIHSQIIPGLLVGCVVAFLTASLSAAPPVSIKLGGSRGLIAIPSNQNSNNPQTKPIFGRGPTGRPSLGGDRPTLRIPDDIIVGRPQIRPTTPLVEAGPLTLAPAILQVLRQDNQWATQRTINGLPVTKFRWSYSDPKAAHARWELFAPIGYGPGPSQGPHQQPGPSAVLLAHGELAMPTPNVKQEFHIELSKYIVGQAPNGAEYRVRVVLYNGANQQFATSNEDQLHRQPGALKVVSYERIDGHLDAQSPAEDAFIRANVQNTGAANYEGGGTYEFYAKTGNNAPILIGKGQILPITTGQTSRIVAMRPVGDWNKGPANSVFTYECKLMP